MWQNDVLVANPGDWLCGEGDGGGGSKYRVLGSVGKGMFGSVFRAVQASTETEVAIKVLRSNPVMYCYKRFCYFIILLGTGLA